MTKKVLSAITLLTAVTLPAAAFAQKKEETVTIETPPSRPATTDITGEPLKRPRDFVADPSGISVGANIGFGTQESYGFGIGGKAGYTLKNRIYLGGALNYHLGNQTETNVATISTHTWLVGPEAGYDFPVGGVILRPVIGAGLAVRTASGSGPNLDSHETDSRFYIAPGGSVIYPIGAFFVGGDARAIVTNQDTTLGLYANLGAHL